MERLGQVVARAGDGDVPLLHRLQQRGLGAGRGAVDLVGHQQAGEDRAFHEAEGAAAAAALVEDLGAEDVGRHQVGRELDAAPVEAQRPGGGFDQLGLGEARRADQQGVAAGEDCGQDEFDHAFLAEHDLADLGPHLGEQLHRGIGFLDDVRGGGRGDFTHAAHLPICGGEPGIEPPMSNAIVPNARNPSRSRT